jgi:uncharacterized protein YoxC
VEAHTLITAGFILLVIAFIGFLVYCAAQIRKVTLTVTVFCKNTDAKLAPLLEETEKALKSIRIVTDDVGAITGNFRQVGDAVGDVAVNIRAISAMIGDVGDQLSLKFHGIRAGVQAALGMLIKNAADRR